MGKYNEKKKGHGSLEEDTEDYMGLYGPITKSYKKQ